MTGTAVQGRWHPALEPLAQAFVASVAVGEERGALCVMREGEVLLDLRGGEAAHGRPWKEDTLACGFSVTKGVLSLLAHRLIDERVVRPDTRVAALWPAFAAEGKGRGTSRSSTC